MNVLTRRATARKNAVTDLEGHQTVGVDQDDDVSAVVWTGPAAWVTKTITGLLLTALAAGPVALILAGVLFYSASQPQAPVEQTSNDAAGADERAAVSAFASDFVATWLTTTTGQEKRLAPFVADYAALSMPDTPWQVHDLALAGITPPEDAPASSSATGGPADGAAGEAAHEPGGAWSVTIAATVSENPQSAGVRRYYQVPIVRSSAGGLMAAALPSPVPGPALAEAPRLGYSYQAAADDPVSTAAGEFLTAMLVGGDVTRFISPGAPIRAVTPPPYTKVAVDQVQTNEDPAHHSTAHPADGDLLRLLVTATATPTAQASAVSVQYALTVTARAGRWEISSLDPSPALAATHEPGSTEPTAPSSTGSTTTSSTDNGTGNAG